jgi:hypothetical protein
LRFLSRFVRKRAEADAAPQATASRTDSTVPVMVLETAEHTFLAEVEPEGERVTDILNREGRLPVVESEGPAAEAVPRSVFKSSQWQSLALDDVLVVVPPPQRPRPDRRLHRPPQPVELRVGPYLVTGRLHAPPGTRAVAWILRTNPRFVPITAAEVRGPHPPVERRATVVVVNLRRVDSLHESE